MKTAVKSSTKAISIKSNSRNTSQVEALRLIAETADSLSRSTADLARKLTGDHRDRRRRK